MSRFLLATIVMLLSTAPTFALDPINRTGPGHLAIRGHDTTGYFLKGKPSSGDKTHTVRWQGATWRFGSARTAALFRADPAAYAPQFGAYCTGGLSQRHVVEGKPQHWRLHKGKLYLFHTAAGARNFSRDPEGTLRRAKAYWATLKIGR